MIVAENPADDEVDDADNADEEVDEQPSKSGNDRGRSRSASSSRLLATTKAYTNKVRSRSLDNAQSNNIVRKPVRLTIPVSPQLRAAKRCGKKPVVSTEELEEQQVEAAMEAEKQRLLKTKKAFERFKLRAAQNIKPTAVRSSKPLTIPHTPKSRLAKKLGPKKCSIVGPQAESTKSSASTKSISPRGLTVVEPFSFASEKRIPVESVKTEVLTAGELSARFMSDPRSHDVPSKVCKSLTDARAPALLTEKRARSGAHPLPMSTEEKEQKLWEEIRQHQFKAKPVNYDVPATIHAPTKVEHRPLTQPQEFEFKTARRATERKSVLPKDDESFAFKAIPMPDFSTRPASPSKNNSNFKPTVATSPKLNGGRRASSAPAHRQRPHHAEVEKQKAEELERLRKAGPVQHRVTETKEFRLISDARGNAYRASLSQRIKAQHEAEDTARNIKATPIPEKLNRPFHVKHSQKELTNFKEFHLKSTDRHEISEQKLQAELKAEEEKLKQEFKALPLPKTTYKPGFELSFDDHALVVPIKVHLESETRAAKRKEFDEKVHAHLEEAEKRKQEELKQQMDKENDDIKQLRRLTVDKGGLMFVAKPIVTKDHFPSKPQKAVTLTQPLSPSFKVKVRQNNQALAEEAAFANIDAF
jgi:hypothetical protein